MDGQQFSAARAFHLLASRSGEIVTLVDEQGFAFYQSPSIERVLGYPPEELVGADVFDLVHPDDRQRARSGMVDQRDSGEADARVSEVRFRHRDGTWRDLEITALNGLADPELRCFVCVSRDITDRKQAEAALRRADAQYRSLVGGLPLISYACDMEGRFTFSEGGALAKLGAQPGEAVGRSAFEMYGDIPTFVDALRRGLAGESVRYVAESAGAVFDNLHTPFYDADGVQCGVVGLAIDITERTRLESELSRARRLDAIGRLAGGVAHDFNNLLTVILGNALEALEEVPPASDAEVAITHVVSAAESAADLTRQLLAFARRQRVEPRLTDLTELVATTAGMLERTAGSDVTWQLQLDSAGIFVMADPGQLEQVLVNLVLNAREATPEGGVVAVRTRRAGPAERPDELPDVDLVVIEVEDTGRGMDAETRSRIFEPFFTTKGPGKGTGLGLASALGIVHQAGGELRVESEPGRGSTFRVYLPVVEPGGRVEAEPPREPVGRGSETVLLVEDARPVGDVAARALDEAGYTLLRAESGPEALAVFAAHRAAIDVLVTDLVMPQMSGLELARRLETERPGLRVLFISGFATDVNGLPQGPQRRFLAKPFRPEALRREVRSLLDGGSAGYRAG